jgi:hypothetical protein
MASIAAIFHGKYMVTRTVCDLGGRFQDFRKVGPDWI